MRRILFIALVFTLSLSFSLVSAQEATAHYDVVKENAAVKIDGAATEAVWTQIGTIDGSFHYPWEAVRAPKTIFRAFQDGQNFYFNFVVYDTDIIVSQKWQGESTVDNEDRVELFFAPGAIDKPGSSGLPVYYAIEVDPLGRVHDYSAVYYRHLETAWHLDGLQTAAKIEKGMYTVEGSIPIASLNKLGLIDGRGIMRTGVYRAEFSNTGKGLDMRWISWVDPKTVDPDYHVNSSFGEFRFID